MDRRQQNIAEARRAPVRSRPLLRWLLCAAVLLMLPKVASAQFSGPAPANSPSLNVRQPLTTDQAVLYPAERDVRLEVGDQMTVRVFGATDYLPTVRVGLDGAIQLPLIGLLQVAGLTVHEAEARIAERLTSEGMYRNPQVTLQLTEAVNQTVTVVGEAHGIVPVVGQKRLYDVLAAVGGLPPTASHTVTINRPGVAQPIVLDLGPDPATSVQANVPVFPRDTVVVARVGIVYVLGAFKIQGAVPIQPSTPLTLLQAAALGGGPGWEGKMNDLRIIRTVGFERKEVRVNIGKVMNGKAPDPLLEPNDIVFLPTNSMKAAIKVGGIGTAMGIISLLIFAARG